MVLARSNYSQMGVERQSNLSRIVVVTAALGVYRAAVRCNKPSVISQKAFRAILLTRAQKQ